MCGRYRLSRRKQLIHEYFDTAEEVDWEPRYNIAPSQSVGIIRQDRAKPERRFSLARWGLIPSWAKDSSIAVRSTPRKDFAADLPAPGCAPGRQSGDARLGRLPRAPHFPAPVSARDHTPRPPCISGLRRAKSRRGSTPAPEDPALLGPNGPALPGPALLQPRK